MDDSAIITTGANVDCSVATDADQLCHITEIYGFDCTGFTITCSTDGIYVSSGSCSGIVSDNFVVLFTEIIGCMSFSLWLL